MQKFPNMRAGSNFAEPNSLDKNLSNKKNHVKIK